jgi:CrcB protein
VSLGTWVAIGALGGVGAVLRAIAGRGPWTVLAVNVTGAFALGLVGTGHPAVAAGLLGALTTFSSWMAQSSILPRSRAALLIVLSLVLGLLAVWAGRGLA